MLNLQHISKSYDDKIILDDIDLAVNPGEVIALIGENGAGKTTLLKIMLGDVLPDKGNIVRNHESIGYVPQEAVLGKNIAASFNKNTKGWQIDQALNSVGLEDKSKSTLVSSLSGGQKTRLAIAKILSTEPKLTILLLDEPTNNLDIEGLIWLEKLIQSFHGGILLVSHDRAFINKVASRVIELHNAKLKHYGGNYDFYKGQKAIEYLSEEQAYSKNIEERKRLKRLIIQKSNLMQQTSTGEFNKFINESKLSYHAARDATQKNLGKQLRTTDSRLEQLPKVEKPELIKNYKINLIGEVSSSKLILRLKKIDKSFNKPVLTNINIEIRGDERVYIKGPNGCGKTTLLKIAAGLLSPDKGEVEVGTNVSIGYFSQDVDGLDYGLTGIDNLKSSGQAMKTIYREARSIGLTAEDLLKTPTELSRGQRAKLSFTKLLLSPNQLLILDEPTNHQDIPTRERIEAALQNYNGAILVASHDEFFLEQVGISKAINLIPYNLSHDNKK